LLDFVRPYPTSKNPLPDSTARYPFGFPADPIRTLPENTPVVASIVPFISADCAVRTPACVTENTPPADINVPPVPSPLIVIFLATT